VANKRDFGSAGENFVANHLKKSGYLIRHMNFYMRGGEIDIVVSKGSVLAFVEVRSWKKQMWSNGTPLETIGYGKIRHIRKTALFYIQKFSIDLNRVDIRFDVAGLIGSDGRYKMDYIENAFTMSE